MDAVSIPAPSSPAPDRVRELAGGSPLVALWRNDYGGVTFRAADGRIIKHGPRQAETTMAAEAARMHWVRTEAGYPAVPEVLEAGEDATEEWLVTRELPGLSAVDPRWLAEPARAIRAVGAGLRRLHDALPVDACPFDWGVPSRLANAAGRGITVPEALHSPPPIDLLVVCHGDACCPNTLLDDAGAPLAHVDLGALGVADRWADIAVAAMSTEWNYGPGWERALIDAYGITPDAERLQYYRDLWNAT